MKVSLINNIDDISRQNWNYITSTGNPFIRHEFLHALEKNHCVGESTGWLPQHCLVYDKDELVALMPLYAKMHSYGEYVFDSGWADAYKQKDLQYYPKWLTAIPFTPCQGPRLYTKPGLPKASIFKVVTDFINKNATTHHISSWHCLYLTPEEAQLLRSDGLIIREGVQFKWRNRGYRDFKDYLSCFNSKRRRTLLRERALVAQQGIALNQVPGADITDEQLHTFFQFYQLTYLKHGHRPYLNLQFFQTIVEKIPEQLLLILAMKDNTCVGAAFNIIGEDSLYGRYWGCSKIYHSLHFEACYYQGLEYCINNGLQHFDPGAQGEHKIARGFEPMASYSAHWVQAPEFASAIAQFTEREAVFISDYRNIVAELLPFKHNI